MTQDTQTLLADLIKMARATGADAADAMAIDATATSVATRLGKTESLERAESGDLGLRVFVGKQQASVSSSDRKPAALREMVERAVAMARLAPEDPFSGLADAASITKSWPQLDLFDPTEASAEFLIKATREAEETALAVAGVTNSEGAEAGASQATITMAISNGFSGQYSRSNTSLSVSVIAGTGTSMEQDSEYASRVFMGDLPNAADIGKRAGEKAVKRLNARKMPTGQIPVVFHPHRGASLLGALAGAISGSSVARGTSFLKDEMDKALFPSAISIVEDPFRARGMRSRPFDGEGLLPSKRKLIDQGTLTGWLLDCRSARQLKLASTGNASRSPGGNPHPSAANLYMEAGSESVADMIKDIKQGFYVTELMGDGVNGVTGDYSQAASGFWIDNGEIVFPVNEMTIAGNLKEMFLTLRAANDLVYERGVDSPTLRIEGMMVAGL